MRRLPWSVTSVEEKPFTKRPSPPFTTSTLQQEANRKLGFSSERTMQIAQRLFQGMDLGGGDLEGLISYHRTDSTTLSTKALAEAGEAVKELYGAEFHNQRQYQTKVRNAQEAHEAIRPTHFQKTPASLEKILESDELKIYELIWKRAVASQMADAKMLRTTVEITGETNDGGPVTFTASGNAIEFAGYLRAYVEGSDDPDGGARRAGDHPAEARGRRSGLVAGQDRRRPDPAGARRQGPPDLAARAFHRSVAGQAS